MSSPHSNRQGPPPVETLLDPSHSNASARDSLVGSGFFLEIPQNLPGPLPHGSHYRSRSAGHLGNTSTTFHFGQRKPSDFAPSVLNGRNPDTPMLFPSDASSQAQASASSSIPPTGSQSGRHLDVFRFGQGDHDTSEPAFSFGSLHNFTPLPSPQALPTIPNPESSSCVHTPSPGSSPMATASVAGGYLSPPHFSLTQSSSTSTPDITSRIRSLSLAEAPNKHVAFSASSQTLLNKDTKGCSQSLVSDVHLKPYDPRDEAGPTQEYFTANVQQKLRNGGGIAKEAVAAVEKLGIAMELDSEVEQLLEEAKEMSSFHSHVTKRIAILGDSGEGKSSLINSLLHFPGLAQTGDIGSACTSVVTEYRHKQEQHTAPITIEVEYLSRAGIKDLLRELLWSYRQLYLPSVESNETSEKDYARYQEESEHAWSALRAAFGHQQRFKKEFLRDMLGGASERVLDQLVLWSREIEWPNGDEGGSWTSTATTAEECCEKTKVFMQDRLWPFTKIIRVYLSSQILKTGVVLADLPGLQDTNLARVQATQDYLMQCDNVFIVAKIARAITNKSVKSSIYSALSRHVPMEWEQSGAKNLNVAVVCTRSEDINIKTAKSEFCGPGKRIPSEIITHLEADIEDSKICQDRQRKKELKRRLELLLIRARNAHVKEGVQQAHSSEISEGKLNVFCVSNTLYEKYCRKGNHELVDASGIVELRRFCHSITAAAQLSAARHYLHSSLASLLNSLGLWAGSLLPARVEPVVHYTGSIEKSLEDAKEKKARQAVFQVRQDFIRSFDEQIISYFTALEPQWDKAAQTEASSWETATQYNAWCLRNGNHHTEKRGAVDWNAMIIWKMRMELELPWELVMDEVVDVFKTLRETIVANLEDLKKLILGSPKTEALTSLANGIDSIIGSSKYKLELAEDTFARGVDVLKRLSSESHTNSYILKEMISSYRSASNQSGPGTAARQRSIVGGKFSGGTIFPNTAIRLSTDMRALVEDTGQALEQLMTGFMRRLEDDMEMALRVSNRENDVMRDNEAHSEHIKAFGRQIELLKARQNALGAF